MGSRWSGWLVASRWSGWLGGPSVRLDALELLLAFANRLLVGRGAARDRIVGWFYRPASVIGGWALAGWLVVASRRTLPDRAAASLVVGLGFDTLIGGFVSLGHPASLTEACAAKTSFRETEPAGVGHANVGRNGDLDPRIDVITLGVADLERAVTFYRDGLGLQTRGIVGTQWEGDETTPAGAVAMFELERGGMLSLYPTTELAKDANTPPDRAQTGGFSLGQIVGSPREVDALLQRAAAAGATVTDEPHDRPWGIYSGYFRDPDGHLWEIIYSPRGENQSSPAA